MYPSNKASLEGTKKLQQENGNQQLKKKRLNKITKERKSTLLAI